MHLDIRTLAILGFLVGVVLSLGFTLLGAVLRERRVLYCWAAGYWLATLGALLYALRGPIAEWISVMGGNAALAFSSALMLRGVALHLGMAPRWRWPLALIAAMLALFAWYEFADRDLVARMRVFSAQCVIWDGWTIALLLHRAPRDIRRSARIAAACFAMDAVFYLVRLFLPIQVLSQDVNQAGAPVAAAYVLAILLNLGMNFALLLLLVERLVIDLGKQARTDGLTGLLNRTALLAEGARALEACRRQRQPCALLLFDLDHFKAINDSHGHEGGDRVLRHFAALVLADGRRDADLFGRYGGEEFLLVLPGLDETGAWQQAERLCRRLAASPLAFEGATIALTASIGLTAARDGADLPQLIREADAALYRAKAAGRNRVAAWSRLGLAAESLATS
ncbi:GGDEF domain-containing protein [Frateuria defendens]|uniref:GGDEF domain-containing protein n=1 Tax=Frateuria defendens TaxID=2219559 RepID=UPI00066FD93B|nr:GGDEF domain-containing protein [Frateuria defendens]